MVTLHRSAMNPRYCHSLIYEIILVLILALYPFSSFCNIIPCDQVVKIESSELYSYLGNVTFVVPHEFSGIWKLEMKTDVPFAFIGGWGVRIKEDGINAQVELQNTKSQDLKAGDSISFRFRISWAPRKPIPKVQEIVWENQLICQATTKIDTSFNSVVKKSQNKKIKRKF